MGVIRDRLIEVLKDVHKGTVSLVPDYEAMADALLASGLTVPERMAKERPLTQEEKIAFRKNWDERVARGLAFERRRM